MIIDFITLIGFDKEGGKMATFVSQVCTASDPETGRRFELRPMPEGGYALFISLIGHGGFIAEIYMPFASFKEAYMTALELIVGGEK